MFYTVDQLTRAFEGQFCLNKKEVISKSSIVRYRSIFYINVRHKNVRYGTIFYRKWEGEYIFFVIVNF